MPGSMALIVESDHLSLIVLQCLIGHSDSVPQNNGSVVNSEPLVFVFRHSIVVLREMLAKHLLINFLITALLNSWC
jgi:hypothetical protein